MIKSELCPKLLPSESHSLGLGGMFSCITRFVLNLEFSLNLFCSQVSSGVIIFFGVDASGPRCLLQFSWCLSNWPLTSQASSNVACERSSVLGNTSDMFCRRFEDLASGLVFQSGQKGLWISPSAIHGSSPCSNLKITSGLET